MYQSINTFFYNYKFDLTSSTSDIEIIDLTGDDTLEISIRNLSNIENAYYLGKDLILNFNVDGNNSKINIQNHKTYGTIENIIINAVGISKTYLNQKLKSFGKSASDLIKIRILIEAKKELIYTNLSVSEIAYKLNFSEPAT